MNSSLGIAKMIREEDDSELKRGPWTAEEDRTLINYIHNHGEGHWNSLARSAGLKRTGKSCRLRWLNYLRPNVRRGNITLEEQLLILELHSRWGNRWSKIAQYLPGRTDNEIKNYWRTRVQKHAKQLKCDVNSQKFKDTVRYLWMPRLVERIQAAAAGGNGVSPATSTATTTADMQSNYQKSFDSNLVGSHVSPASENSSTAASSEYSFATQVSPVLDFSGDQYSIPMMENRILDYSYYYGDSSCLSTSPSGYNFEYGSDFPAMAQSSDSSWLDSGETSDSLWNVDDIWLVQQQLNGNV